MPAPTNFPLQEGKVVILCDDREGGGECVEVLRKLEAVVHSQRLPVADFVCSERVAIERKTAADFESSVIDGRIFQQAAELKANFSSPILTIVGNDFQRLGKKARRGAFLSLAIDYNLPLFFLESERSLAEFIYSIGFREQLRPVKEVRLRFEKRALSEDASKQFIVESLPGVGPGLAKSLLEHFGSVENVFTAEQEDLLEVAGIGKEKAAAIRKVVAGGYGREEGKN